MMRSVSCAQMRRGGWTGLVAAVAIAAGGGCGGGGGRAAVDAAGPAAVDAGADGGSGAVDAGFGGGVCGAADAGAACSLPGFPSAPVPPLVAQMSGIVVTDLNGDGKPDLVGADWNTRTFSTAVGNGDGTFGSRGHYQSPELGTSIVAVVDVNGDGKPDIITGQSDATQALGVMLGNGDGTFGNPAALDAPVPPAILSVAVADVNGDGKQDVVVTARGSSPGVGTVNAYIGNGDGTFQAGVDSPAGSFLFMRAAVDVSHDGNLDLVLTDDNGSVAVMPGNGDGSFGAPAGDYSLTGTLAVADINGDGNLDLVGSRGGALLGRGDGTFPDSIAYPASGEAIAVADVNGDGHADIITADVDGTISLSLGSAGGAFRRGAAFSVGADAYAVKAADVNGDGATDLVVTHFGISLPDVSVVLGNGDGSFPAREEYPAGGYTTSVAVADVSGDGRPDVIVANGGVPPPPPVRRVAGESDTLATYMTNSLSVWVGNGDGTFRGPLYQPTPEAARAVTTAELNGDGRADVVVTGEGMVSVLLGQGDGSFGVHASYAVAGARRVAVGDLDGDGKPDLVVVGAGQIDAMFAGSVSAMLGNGDGTFQAPISHVIPVYPTAEVTGALAVVDISGDGRADVVLGDGTWLVGNGDGTFHDGDGRVEGGAVAVAEAAEDGDCKLGLRRGGFASSVAVADVNGDGAADVVSPREGVGVVDVSLAGGGGGQYPTGQSPKAAAVADVNGDGRPDIIVAHGTGVSVQLQSCLR